MFSFVVLFTFFIGWYIYIYLFCFLFFFLLSLFDILPIIIICIMKKATTVLHFRCLLLSEVMVNLYRWTYLQTKFLGLSPNCIGTSSNWYELEVVRVDDGTSWHGMSWQWYELTGYHLFQRCFTHTKLTSKVHQLMKTKRSKVYNNPQSIIVMVKSTNFNFN
jgi:hypothetical protein